ncbi:MAG: ABC transporter substrate-binding protein [Eggerthellaceae bacterium]|nr:ABC transporter substrate-binding protein [Eggerthellaceae bacterium]
MTRRGAVSLLAVAALSIPITGCSSNADTAADSGSSAGSGADASAESTTRTVATDKGDVEIPANPATIVSDYYLGELLAVNVKPVIASPYALNNPFLAGMCDGIEPMNVTSAETSLEMIAAAHPDLIITITEADVDKYSAIAPTVFIQDGTRTDEELFLYIADLVNKKDEAQAWVNEFNDNVAAVRDEMREIVGDGTVSILEVWPQEIYTMGSHFARGGSILYDMWGLKAPEPIQTAMVDGDETYEVISLEALPQYAGDFILHGVLDGTDSAFVDDSTLWNNLPAVKDGRVLQYEQVAFMHRDPITLKNQLQIFIDFFRAHADK